MIFDGIIHIWTPGTAFMSSNHDVWGGRPWVGFLEFTFQGDRFSLETQ